ncbi:3-oxoacyl-[acyl-carrier-protein] reductase [soil metagenome]
MNELARKTVLVTGASRGLGRAMAERFAKDGAYVVVGYRRREEEAKETLARLREVGGDGEIVGFDVTKSDEVERAVRELAQRRPSLDVVVNNAGIVDDVPFALMEVAQWERVVRTDLDGTFHVCRAVVREMMRKKSGAIVNVASASASRALPHQSNYAAAKGAVVAFTRALAAELAPHGIRVNAVLPGLIDAGMGARVPHDLSTKLVGLVPARRMGTAAEVAEVVRFLASDAASYVTGQALAVDGGLSL